MPTTNKEERLRFPVELRTKAPDGDAAAPRKIVGKPAVFNVLSEDLGGFRERILPGAFTKTLQESNVKSLWNHDPNYVFGSRKAGTLDIREDDFGLDFSATPPDTEWARGFLASIERGDVDEMSFMFQVVKDRWIIGADDDGESVVRELIEVRLFEVSPVTFPAYPQTSVSLRSAFGTDDRAAVIAQLKGEPEQELHSADAAASKAAADRLFRARGEL